MDSKYNQDAKIALANGDLIDRANTAFSLQQHPKSKGLFRDSQGRTYVKDSKGTLRRFPPKEKKRN